MLVSSATCCGSFGFGFLRIMVARNEAAGGGAGKRMAAADIMAGDPPTIAPRMHPLANTGAAVTLETSAAASMA